MNIGGFSDRDLGELKGLPHLKELALVRTHVSDEGLRHLQDLNLTNLSIELHQTALTAKGLAHLGGIKTLRDLRLTVVPFTDGDLSSFHEMRDLRKLLLDGTGVTDAGLEHLKGLTNLAELNLNKTSVTATGVAKLQAALPGCKITWDGSEEHNADSAASADDMVTLPNGWRVGKPVNLGPVVNSEYSELRAAMTADGLELILESPREKGTPTRLWTCTRADRGQPWGAPVMLRLGTGGEEEDWDPALSADGLTLLFSSRRPGSSNFDLWACTRADRTKPWGEPAQLGPTVNGYASEWNPAISGDGLTLVFDSNHGGTKGANLYLSSRASTAEPWGKRFDLGPTLNTEHGDLEPTLASDGLTLIFSSNRPGGHGEFDLWMSTRTSTTEPFGPPINLGTSLNTEFAEQAPTLSADSRELLFASDRPGGWGKSDLWSVPILPPVASSTQTANHALRFRPEDDPNVVIPSLQIRSGDPFTFEAWVNVEHIRKDWDGGGGDIFRSWIPLPDKRQGADAQFTLLSDPSGGFMFIHLRHGGESDATSTLRNETKLSSPAFTPGVLRHLAAVSDGRMLRLFVDGRSVSEPQALPTGNDATSHSCYIGSKFDGIIDEVRISKVARYAEDFTPVEGFEPDEHTLALYHFDEAQGDVLKDSSGNGHDGKIVGATWVQTSRVRETHQNDSESERESAVRSTHPSL